MKKMKSVPDEIKGQIVDHVRMVLSRHDEILFAFIYGSFVNQSVAGLYGDIDVAIYPQYSVEEQESYTIESKIEQDILNDLSIHTLNYIPAEVTNLKLAPYYLRVSLLKQPYIMVKADEESFTFFIEDTSAIAMDNNHLRKESVREVLE